MPLDPARRAAAGLVHAVLDHGRPLEAAMTELRAFALLEGPDRAFARAIASTTLRRLGEVDAVLAAFMKRPLQAGAEIPRALLRTGATQLLAMGVAAHAVVSETVGLAKASAASLPFSGLINAVLRRVDREGAALFAAQPPGADLPDWLFTRWRAAYGDQTAAAIAAACRMEAPLDLTVKADAPGWAARLGGAVTPTGSVRLPAATDVGALAGYAEGAWWVQDAAAALPVQLLGDVRGRRVLDLCAAPGGKTMQIAAGGARVTAVDADAIRMQRVRENLARTGLSADLVCADILSWTPPAGGFDAVLLDAPCTASGTVRRHPDIPHLRRPSDIAALQAMQTALAARAAGFLKPGGVLVYAVCSLEPEEGEGVLPALLSAGLEPAPFAPPGLAGLLDKAGALRTHPGLYPDIGGMDGFYAARFQRPL